MPGKVYQKRQRCAPPFLRYPKKTAGGGVFKHPHTLGRRLKLNILKFRVRYFLEHVILHLYCSFCTLLFNPIFAEFLKIEPILVKIGDPTKTSISQKFSDQL